jgi:ABC-type multidrug transport system permease subunit
VLVLDEPTSGLDAAAALNVCNVLRALADSGITVATSLHQPRSSIMALFDQLMILAAGRRIFYGGVVNYLPYLQNHLSCEVPPFESPYDLMLDLLNPAIEAQAICSNVVPKEGESLVLALADAYDCSELRDSVDRVASVRGVDWVLFHEAKINMGWMSKFWTLLTRTFIIKARDPSVLVTQIATAIFMGLIFGSIYFDTYGKDKAELAILDTQMCVTMTVVMSVWLPFDVTLTFPKERRVFLRERKAGLYPTTAFYFARILADMPMHIVAATIQALIIYYMAQLRMGVHYFVFVNVLGVLVGASLMQTIGAICRTFEEANLLMMPVMMLAMMTSTTFVRQVPSWMEWMKGISVMGLLADVASYWEFRNASPSLGNGEQVLEEYNIRIQSADDVLEAIAVLVAILLAARLVTFLGVKFLHTGRSSCAENLAD